MQQPPSNNQWNNQSSFYNQSTQAGQPLPPQVPYQGNIPPPRNVGQFQYQPVPAPPQKPPAWRRFRSTRKHTQWGIGCGALLFILALCSCVGIISPSTLGFHDISSPTTAPTVASTQAAFVTTAIPTTKPTTKPTPLVKPTDTPIPTTVPTKVPTSVPTALPTAVPTQAPTQPPAKTGLNGNPWGYDLNPGNLIYSPPPTICSYFNCIASFWTYTNGYVDKCVDGTYSHSGGVRGACSHHGGESQPLYSH